MDEPGEIADITEVFTELSGAMPVEAFPIYVLPVQTISWFARIVEFFGAHAYLLAFTGAFVENTIFLGFLLPGGTVVALSGAGARTAGLSLPLLVLLGALGMIGGAIVDYYVGRAGATRLLHHRWTGQWGPKLAAQIDQAAPTLTSHGWWMMLIAHAFGHGRSSLAVAAGASGLPLPRFLLMEVPAALLWSGFYGGGAYYLAGHWETLELAMRRAGWVGAAFAALGLAGWWLVRRMRSRHVAEAAPAATSPATPSSAASVTVAGASVTSASLAMATTRPTTAIPSSPAEGHSAGRTTGNSATIPAVVHVPVNRR